MNKREDQKMKESMDELIDAAFDGMKLGDDFTSVKKEHATLSLSVPKEYHKKFQELQAKSDKDFGKRLVSFFIRSVDKFSV